MILVCYSHLFSALNYEYGMGQFVSNVNECGRLQRVSNVNENSGAGEIMEVGWLFTLFFPSHLFIYLFCIYF